MKPRIGSLFSGSGMLDEGVRAVIGGDVAWHAEVDPAASKVLAHRYSGVPNLGDITAVDWATVEPVDVITGGSPCQDVSHAGKRAGMREGTRSGLWARMCDAIEALRPAMVVWENVRGVLSAEADSAVEPCPGCVGDGDDGPVLRALGRVLGDLAELGYDTSWHGLRAADVGAPHGRFRVFVVARDAKDSGRHDARSAGTASDRKPAREARGSSGIVADAEPQHGRPRRPAPGRPSRAHVELAGRGGAPAADADNTGSQGRESAPGRHLPARSVAADSNRDALRLQPVAEPGGIGPTVVGDPVLACCGHTLSAHAADRCVGQRWDGTGCPCRAHIATDAPIGGRPHEPIGGDTQGQHERAVAGSGGGDSAGAASEGVRELGGAAPVVAWGQYEPAIRRWERVLGRPAPAPTEPGTRGGQRLSPRLTEWMMGWPDGWVTDVPGISRNDALKICGNGVVPQQAAEALRRMLTAGEVAA